ncbi:MAG: DNA helicase PcrA [Clostridia bacterium]|nr:DNA helicase PcrA [Clostridia bacterium]
MSNLNDKQLEAVNTVNGPVLILAGAGSGKTTVLINRINHMISDCKITPWSILTITFTNKAANEIKERLANTIGEDAKDIWASTFHSMCVRILRRDAEKIGYKSGFTIYDSADSNTLIKECIKELGYNDKDFAPKMVLSVISSAKDKLITPSAFSHEYAGDFRMEKIGKLYELYQRKLKSYNAFDYDDLIMQTVNLFEHNEDVLEYYQHRFKYIMVDEYQDTSHSQYRLIYNLAKSHCNICVVGDDDQSIYKFRGADISNILDFEKQFKDTKIIKLEQNYRSTQPILDAANAVIKNNTGRKDKKLWTGKTEGEKVTVYCAANEREEAYFAVRKIEEYVRNGGTYKNIAVLFRMNAQSRVIEEVLLNNAIPYRLLSGIKFYDRKEIKDIIAYLRLLVNLTDDISLTRIINEPKRSIGKTTVDKVARIAYDNNTSMFQILCNVIEHEELRRSAVNIISFTNLINSLKNKINELSVSEIVKNLISESGYVYALEKENTVEAKTRIENINEFLSVVAEFEKAMPDGTLIDFLEGVSLLSDIDNYDDEQDAVTLMTLHSAKGLEFPVVFMVGMEENVFPSSASMFSTEEIEEERRLCYVGITRAKEKLYLIASASRMIFGQTSYNPPSRFLSEIPSDLLDGELTRQRESAYKIENEIKNYSTIFNKSLTQSSPKTGNADFKVGDRVKHMRFGEGTVLSAIPMGSDMKLSVAFDSVGTKNLMATFAKLKKI